MQSNDRGYKEKQAALGDLSILGGQVVHDVMLIGMPDYLSNKDIANLCLTSYAFRDIFKQAIADRLLGLIMDVNHVCPNVHAKLDLILRIIKSDPELMFRKARANSLYLSPCEYVYCYPDIYLQLQFMGIATEHKMLDAYILQSSSQTCKVNIDHLRSLFDKQLVLLDELMKHAISLLYIPLDDVAALQANERARIEIATQVSNLAKTEIAHAELEELPRCVLDEAIRLKPLDAEASPADEEYDDPTPPKNYHVYDDGDGEYEHCFRDLLEFAPEPGQHANNDFIFCASRYKDGQIAIHHGSPIQPEEVRRDQQYIIGLFQKCIEKTEQHKATAKLFREWTKQKK